MDCIYTNLHLNNININFNCHYWRHSVICMVTEIEDAEVSLFRLRKYLERKNPKLLKEFDNEIEEENVLIYT